MHLQRPAPPGREAAESVDDPTAGGGARRDAGPLDSGGVLEDLWDVPRGGSQGRYRPYRRAGMASGSRQERDLGLPIYWFAPPSPGKRRLRVTLKVGAILVLLAVGEAAMRGPDATPYDGLRRWVVALLGTQPGLGVAVADPRPSAPAPGARLPPARTEAADVDAAAPVVSEDPASEPEAVDSGAPGGAESGGPPLAPTTSPTVSNPPDSPAERAPPPLTASPPSPIAPIWVATPPGRLSLQSFPWGSAYLDGAYVGDTPLIGLAVPAGEHTIRIERAGYETHFELLTVEPGEALRITGVVLRRGGE